MAGRKPRKIIDKYHPWDLKRSGYLIKTEIENAILRDATVLDTPYFTTHIMATRKIVLLTSVFPPTRVTRVLTKLRTKLSLI